MPPSWVPEIAAFAEHEVHLAVSLYAHRPAVHDRITRVTGSFRATASRLRDLIERGIPLRVAVIVMKENESEVEETLRFLEELGIARERIGTDGVRPTGRGRDRGKPADETSTGEAARAGRRDHPDPGG